MKFILSAGGQGIKLWPYSKESYPKQFQKLINNESLFSYNANVLLKEHPPQDLYVSTKKMYVDFVKEQVPQIPLENYIIEPDIAKDRGPAQGYAFLKLAIAHPEEPFMIVQTDCLRLPPEKYLEMVSTMEKLVRRDKKFISGGQKATFPVLGVDYLQLGKKVKLDTALEIYEVDKFIERNNDYHKTKNLIENEHVTTHCNHNCWYPTLMLDAYKKYMPSWHTDLMKIKDVLENKNYSESQKEEKITEIYSQMESGRTEKVTDNLFSQGYAIITPFKWIDIGTWDSVYKFFSQEKDVVCTQGETVVALESERSFIKNDNPDKLVAILGVEDMIIVDTKDILLVVPRDKADKTKLILEELKEKDLTKYL